MLIECMDPYKQTSYSFSPRRRAKYQGVSGRERESRRKRKEKGKKKKKERSKKKKNTKNDLGTDPRNEADSVSPGSA